MAWGETTCGASTLTGLQLQGPELVIKLKTEGFEIGAVLIADRHTTSDVVRQAIIPLSATGSDTGADRRRVPNSHGCELRLEGIDLTKL